MRDVSPAFDPSTGTWFTDDGEEAPTLRELARVLGPRVRIVGYAVRDDKIAARRPRREAPSRETIKPGPKTSGLKFRSLGPPPPRKKPERTGPSTEWTSEKDARIVALKKSGRSTSEIARDVGATRLAVIGRLYRLRHGSLSRGREYVD